MTYQSLLAYFSQILDTFVTTNTALVANAIAPAVYSLLGLYVILWGVLSLRGMIDQPIIEAAVRFAKIALICTVALKLGHYNELIKDTFVNGPEDLAGTLTASANAATNVASLDAILKTGFTVANGFWVKGGLLTGDIGAYLIAIIVWGTTIAVTVYSFLLIVLSKVMICLIIGFGPIFIISLLFDATKGFFSAWIHQITNFGLLSVLVVGCNMIFMTLFQRAASSASAATQIDHIIPMVLVGIVVFAALAQLTSVAAGLAGGLSLSSQGAGRLGLSALTGTAGKAGSLMKYGIGKIPKPSLPRVPKREPRDFSPKQISYENRDNQIGRP